MPRRRRQGLTLTAPQVLLTPYLRTPPILPKSQSKLHTQGFCAITEIPEQGGPPPAMPDRPLGLFKSTLVA